MIKPLLRIIPNLSGNVKLCCTLRDFNKLTDNTFETNIRGALLNPLSHTLYQKNINVSLLNSSYEYDLKKFYTAYSDEFYSSCFEFNKKDMLKLDRTSDVYVRNSDFEFGVKRISYEKSGNQLAFFAPIYMDNINDIPDYFLIEINLSTPYNRTTKYIKVNIGSNKESKYNYIYKYLSKYLKNIDDNVAYMDNVDKTVTYYAIDLVNGGFTKKTDPSIKALFDIKMPIQMFDRTLMESFSKNNLCMKQIIPLAFYFSVNDVLSEFEQDLYKYASININGAYYKDNEKLDTYDFDFDYTQYSQDIYQMNYMNGDMIESNGYVKNIMDVAFPGFNETNLLPYLYANKVTTSFCKWKLKYSTDEWPYITNMSWVYSKNQNSNYKYREFPTSFLPMSAYAIVTNGRYNMRFPIGDDKILYNNFNERSDEKYRDIINNYCVSWFDTVHMFNKQKFIIDTEYRDSIINSVEFTPTNDGWVYHKGILYNFNDIYNQIENFDEKDKIDYFSVIININTSNIFDESYIKENLKFVSFNLAKSKYPYNVAYNDIYYRNDNKNNLLDIFNTNYNTNLSFNNVYDKIKDKTVDDLKDNETVFINTADLHNSDLDLYNINAVIKPSDNIGLTMLSMVSKLKYNKSNANNVIYNSYIDEAISNLFDNSTEYYDFINNKYYKNFKEIILQQIDKNNLENNLPFIFTQNYGKSLYELLPVYKANEYIDDKSKIFNCFYRRYPLFINNVLHNSYHRLFDDNDIKNMSSNNVYLNSEFNVFNPQIIEYINEGGKYNIPIIPNLEYTGDTYYHSLYYKSYFIDKDYLTENKSGFDNNVLSCITRYVISNSNYTLSDMSSVNTTTWQMKENVTNLFNKIFNKLSDLCGSNNVKQKYLYYPYKEYMNNNIGNNIAYKINSHYNEFTDDIYYEDTIDDNVLYIHPYNVSNLNEGKFDKNIFEFKVFYGKILSTTHLSAIINKTTDDYKIIEDINIGVDFNKRFFKQYKVIYRNPNGYNQIKFAYKQIDDINDLYMNVIYDYNVNMFYLKNDDDTKDYFNIVEKTAYIKLNNDIFEYININDVNKYKDMYIYRPILDLEYDDKYGKSIKLKVVNDNTDLIIEDTDTMLYHVFNEKYIQYRDETIIYTNWILDNISEVKYYENNNDYKTYYRYNQNNAKLFLEVDKQSLKGICTAYNITNYNDINIYKDLNNGSIASLDDDTDKTTLLGQNNINIVRHNGKNYGFYLLNVNIDNTYNTFNIYGMLDESSKSNNYTDMNQFNLLRFINVINDNLVPYYDDETKIDKGKEYISKIFCQLCPFLNIDLFSCINSINTLVKPYKFNLSELYKTSQYNLENNSTEQSLIYMDESLFTVKKQVLQRYTNSITPYIRKSNVIPNMYLLKLKEVNADMLKTGEYKSLGDYCMYSRLGFIDKFENYNIYNIDDTTVTNTYKPLEYKYYNDNKYINLEEYFEYTLPNLYIYDELLGLQDEKHTLDIFKNHIIHYLEDLKDEEILFLYKKYKHTYSTSFQRVSIDNTNKLYKLTYKFNLY